MTESGSNLEDALQKTKAYLRHLELTGDTFLPKSKPAPSPSPLAEGKNPLTPLGNEVIICIKCDVLAKSRKSVVFGAGNPRAELVFVGEAPGFDEDEQGLPFVGKAGQLLTKIIEAMKLTRDDVYICNVLKCRPPGNRNPLPDEIINCKPYLMKQLEIIRPKVVCALGNFAAQVLLKSELSISELRGRFFEVDGIKILPTYHPAYILRNPGEKRKVWADMQLIMKELGL